MTVFVTRTFYVTSYKKRQPWKDVRVDEVVGESAANVRVKLRNDPQYADCTIVSVSSNKPREEPPPVDLTQVSDEAIAAELERRKQAKDEAEKVRRKERHALVVKYAFVLAEFVPFHLQENGKFVCNDDNLSSARRYYDDKTPKCPRCFLLEAGRSDYNDGIDVMLRFLWSPSDLRTLEEDKEGGRW